MNELIAVKCSNCGIEIVISKNDIDSITCHQCQIALSIENKLDNHPNPSLTIPYKYSKEEILTEFNKILTKRKFFVNPDFFNLVNEESLKKIYLPYLIIDLKAHVTFEGEGETTLNKNIVSFGNGRTATKYDVEIFKIKREFDLEYNQLEVERHLLKINQNNLNRVSKIINEVGTFDMKEAIPFNIENFTGTTSERKQLNGKQLQELVIAEIKDISKQKITETLTMYDRGIKWNINDLVVTKQEWKVVYLPIYFYNYFQNSNPNSFYLVANASSKEMYGLIPTNKNKITLLTMLIAALGIASLILINTVLGFVLITSALVTYIVLNKIFSTINKINPQETKTTTTKTSNLSTTDTSIKKMYSIASDRMYGANNKIIEEENLVKAKIAELLNNDEKF